MDREEYKDILGDELCDFCPWKKGEIGHRCESLCEGAWCDYALDNFIEENQDYFDDEE